MLWTNENFPVVDGVAEGYIGERDVRWEKALLDRRVLAILMGDPRSGPSVVVVDVPPKPPMDARSPMQRLKHKSLSRLPAPAQQLLRSALSYHLVHFHRSDSFRMVVEDDPARSFTFGRRWHYFGDYRLQPANVPYREWFSEAGSLELSIDADRRGHPPIDKHLRSVNDMDTIRASLKDAGSYVSQLRTIHVRNEQAVTGLASTVAGAVPRSGLSGSFEEDGWTRLSDGSSVAALFMGAPVTGPLVLLSRNAPGAIEAPAGTYKSEMLRLILKGGCRIGVSSYGPGAWRLTDAEVAQGSIVHGSEGSTQLVFLADRRGCIPATKGELAIEQVPRLGELADVLAPFVDSEFLYAAS